MRKYSKYRIYFTDGTDLELPYCSLQTSIDGNFLLQREPSDYVREISRTFVLANVKYWEPTE